MVTQGSSFLEKAASAAISDLESSTLGLHTLDDCVPPIGEGERIRRKVAAPVAGYNYNSVWTPLLAGLSPAGMAASVAALVRPCGARGFVDPADAVLHQCIRLPIGAS